MLLEVTSAILSPLPAAPFGPTKLAIVLELVQLGLVRSPSMMMAFVSDVDCKAMRGLTEMLEIVNLEPGLYGVKMRFPDVVAVTVSDTDPAPINPDVNPPSEYISPWAWTLETVKETS